MTAARSTLIEELELIDVRVHEHAHAGAANGVANGPHYGAGRVEYDVASASINYEEYHPFGTSAYRAVDSTIQVTAKRYRYAAAERDEETGLDHMGLRYYAPWLGRWTSADPIGLPGGINLYEYAASNPVNMVDPGGTKPQTVHQEGMKQFESRAAETSRLESQLSRSEADFQTRVHEILGPERFANLDVDPVQREALIDEARNIQFAWGDLKAMRAELDADIKAFTRDADAAARIGRYARPVETAGFVVLGGTAALLAAPFAVAAAHAAARKAIVASPGGVIAAKELAFEFAQGEGGALPRTGAARGASRATQAAVQEAKIAAKGGVSPDVLRNEKALRGALTEAGATTKDVGSLKLSELPPGSKERVFLGHFGGSGIKTEGVRADVPSAGLQFLEAQASQHGGRTLEGLPGNIEALAPEIKGAKEIIFNIGERGLKPGSLTAQELDLILSDPELLKRTTFIFGGTF